MAPILLLACATVVTALLEPNPKQGLESRLSAMEHVVATLQSRVNETERDLAASRAEVAHLQSQLKSAQTETIAFEVVLQMRSQNISNHANLIFDTTPLNLGSHYNMFTGVFVSPFPAVYLLWANVQSGSEGDFGVNLMIDGLKKASGFTGSKNSYGTASLSSVNYLNKGTRVSFQHQQFLTKTTLRGNGYSSFGGVLIHRWGN